MEQVQNPAFELFNSLNQRMHVLITNAVQKAFGGPDERKFMTTLTDAGIESAYELIGLVEEGLTYEIWIEFLRKKNDISGPLGLFENEDGDMAAIIQGFNEADLRPVFDQFTAEGVFTVETIQRDIDLLKQRKQWAEQMWGREDQQDTAADTLAQVAKETVDAPAETK